MDGGAWWAIVHGVAKSRTRLSDWPQHSTERWVVFSALYSRISKKIVSKKPVKTLQIHEWRIRWWSQVKNVLYLPAAWKLGDSSEQMKKISLEKNLPILYRDNAEALCLVYSTQKSPRGFGKRWLLPICSVFSSDGVGGAHLPICLLHSLTHWAPRCHGPSHRVWRNKIPLTSDTGPPQAANLFSFRGPLPLCSPFRMQEILPVHPARVMRQTMIGFSFI